MENFAFIYFNQNNYANTPYPGPGRPQATVRSGGCGVTCAAMIIQNLTPYRLDPAGMAAYAIEKGARNSGGTDMNILASALREDYGLAFTTTSDEQSLITHLASGHMAIANVGGNRPGYSGVFSDGGHFVVCAGVTENHKLIILDPGYYTGKFKKTGRVGKVKVNGNECICDLAVLGEDTSNRAPSYWLFYRKEAETIMKLGLEMAEVKVTLNGVDINKAVILNVDGKDTAYIPAVALKDAGIRVEWDNANSTVVIKTEE